MSISVVYEYIIVIMVLYVCKIINVLRNLINDLCLEQQIM